MNVCICRSDSINLLLKPIIWQAGVQCERLLHRHVTSPSACLSLREEESLRCDQSFSQKPELFFPHSREGGFLWSWSGPVRGAKVRLWVKWDGGGNIKRGNMPGISPLIFGTRQQRRSWTLSRTATRSRKVLHIEDYVATQQAEQHKIWQNVSDKWWVFSPTVAFLFFCNRSRRQRTTFVLKTIRWVTSCC